MKLEFNKVNDNLFRVEKSQELVDKVEQALSSITLCDNKLFSSEVDGALKDKLVSRLVASAFKSQYPDYLDNNSLFVRIIVPYNDKTINVTYGEIFHNNEVKILNGVLY